MRGQYGLYKVCGRRKYRGHDPGSLFEAVLQPLAEARAIRRGDIILLERITPRVQPGSYQLPRDWPPPTANTPEDTEAPEGASFIGEGGKK
jgi:hypothetical protein